METWEDRLAAVQDELTFAGSWNDRYRMLVDWGTDLEPLAEPDRTFEWEVSGCSSPLWLRIGREAGVVRVGGFSPGILPQALVALLVKLYDGLPAAGGTPAAVVDALDLRRNLSPTRLLVFERMVDRVVRLGGPL